MDETFKRAASTVVTIDLHGHILAVQEKPPENYVDIQRDLAKRNTAIRYIMGPYTWKPDAGVTYAPEDLHAKRSEAHHAKFEQHARGAVQWMLDHPNEIAFSPIVLCHPIDVIISRTGKHLSSDFWTDLDEHSLRLTTGAALLTIPGHDKSSGVKRELKHFGECDQTVEVFVPNAFIEGPVIPKFAEAAAQQPKTAQSSR